MKKLAALSLVLAFGACKSSSDSKSPSAETVASADGESTGRTGKIDLPKLTPQPGQAARPDDRADSRAERMKRFDKDGDGELSDEERQAIRDARRERMMERIDTDGDGKISDAEREANRLRREQERVERFDTDGDGKVSDAERDAAMQERAASTHARMDTNGDGKVTPDELASLRWFSGDSTKVDVNGDGQVSVEELQKAMRDNGRARFRGRGADGAGSGSGQ